jgi:hypothetical protein
MPRSIRALLVAFLVILALGTLAFVVLKPAPPARLPLPNPNGYDDFIKASGMVTQDVGNFSDLDHESLRELVSTNAEVLRLLRVGLTRRCLMPLDSALTNSGVMLGGLTGMKRLVQLLAAEGRLAGMENRPADAARSYTDAIHFGNEISRGGMLITRLVGIACEAIGCGQLAKVVPKLDAKDCRAAVGELEKVDSERVAWSEVLRNERYYAGHVMNNRFNPIIFVGAWVQTWQTRHKAEVRHKTIVAHERLVMAELALRCYQSEQGRAPGQLSELIPNLVSKIPQDPFSGQPLIYKPHGTNWLLYSVGPDGVDDGGKPAGGGLSAKGDLFFDSSW